MLDEQQTTYLIISGVSSAITALLAAIVTVRLSLKKFYTEKWWERKADTYSKVIECLHYLKRMPSEKLDEEMLAKKLSDERKQELWEAYKKARDELNKIIDAGSFLMSDKAVAVLEIMQKKIQESDNAQSYFEHLDGEFAALDSCLKEMRQIARTDLKAP